MRTLTVALAAILALAIANSSYAGEKPRARQDAPNQSKKVWTNDDLDQLRARGLLSIVGPDAPQEPSQARAADSYTEPSVYVSRLQDPAWYAQKTADLQAQLETRQAALYVQQTAISLAADRITQPGVAMYKTNAGVTPAAGLANLQAQVNEIQNEINELGELARVNGVAPGTLRS
jgi:hypothetical protein